MAFVRAMYKKGTGNNKQRKDEGNRMLYLCRIFSQAIMSNNSNDAHFSGVRFICGPYLTNKSVLASLRPIMTRYGLQMNPMPLLMLRILYTKFYIELLYLNQNIPSIALSRC